MFSLFISEILAFPSWPSRYTIIGTWKVPYTNLSNPITIVHEPGRQYTNQLNGLEQIWNSEPKERLHMKTVVAGNKTVCMTIFPDQPFEVELTEFLPDPEGFVLQKGDYTYHGILCDLWLKKVDSGKTQTYKMYIDKQGNPVAYWVEAISVFHSHYDVYVLEIEQFFKEALPGYWNLPEVCENPIKDPYPGNGFNLFFPSAKSAKTVVHNAQQKRSKGEPLNGRFAHVEKDDFMESMRMQRNARLLLKEKNKNNQDKNETCKVYKAQGITLPAEFSWRNYTDVVTPPRDQVACGSCWAFSAAGALESAFALKTGKLRAVSVNQIMDCTWDHGNSGCQGGFDDAAFLGLRKNKIKIVEEGKYPYIGASGYCNNDFDDYLGYVDECYHVFPSTNAVKEALYKFGPLGIAIHVTEAMSLYTGGVIDDEECTGAEDDLMHAVQLTGWKIVDGKEAWEIKNSWSTYWGYEGYLYIQLKDQEKNCGVTTDAFAVVVSPKTN